MSLLAVWSKGD